MKICFSCFFFKFYAFFDKRYKELFWWSFHSALQNIVWTMVVDSIFTTSWAFGVQKPSHLANSHKNGSHNNRNMSLAIFISIWPGPGAWIILSKICLNSNSEVSFLWVSLWIVKNSSHSSFDNLWFLPLP